VLETNSQCDRQSSNQVITKLLKTNYKCI